MANDLSLALPSPLPSALPSAAMDRMIEGRSAAVRGAQIPRPGLAGAANTQPESPLEAARQFEAVLVEQIFKVFRESASSGWLGTGEDSSASSILEFGEQELARVIAKAGGFGLASMIEEGITRQRREEANRPLPNALP